MSDKNLDEVCKIIDINRDAAEFYHEAHQKAEDQEIQKIFKNYEDLHHSVVVDLQTFVREQGGDPETNGTIIGNMQEMWGKAKASLTSDVDESLISSLEEAEDRCIHNIKDAIKDENLSANARMALQRQESTLQQSHDYMKMMKDRAKAA